MNEKPCRVRTPPHRNSPILTFGFIGFNGDYTSHRFGVELTVEDICRRISWEMEAEGMAMKAGHPEIAEGHTHIRKAYAELLEKK